MELTVYKVYNRVVHSYLAVFEATQTGSEDINIFVCKDLPANAPIPPAPPQESSLEPESSAEETSSEVSDGSPAMEVSSYEEVSSGVEETSSGAEEAVSSTEPEEGTSSEYSVAPSMAEVSSDVTAVESSEESSSTAPLFVVFPARTLVSVASLTDIDLLPLAPIARGNLYRASTVAMLFRSEKHMNDVINLVLADVRINADLQRMPIEDYEVVELTDPVYGQDENRIYYFR